tara:strand:- start:615 stop:1121 length:507 start_codon:yes stop_codon:yes gene_type:complete
MSLIKKFDRLVEKILEGEYDISETEKDEEIDEISVTANVAGYQTPYAFSGKTKKDKKKRKKTATASTGYELVGEKKISHGDVLREIYGLNYNKYKKDESLNAKQKVNGAIREVSKRLLQIERIVNRNIKLKTEAGVDGTQYWKSTRKNLGKISERMNRISARLRNLSS